MTFCRTNTIGAALMGCCLLACGCKPRQMGIAFSDTQAVKVDSSWIAAARSCWPALAHNDYTRESVAHEIADPLHFRAAFGSYSALSDSRIETVVTQPIMNAPVPDSSTLHDASGAVLTRDQAVSFDGNPPEHFASDRIPPDALCSIHSGTPVGF